MILQKMFLSLIQLAEYKEHVKTNLVEKKENEAKHAKEDAAVDKNHRECTDGYS